MVEETNTAVSHDLSSDRALTIVLAPDSFKGTATAAQAAEWIGEGIALVLPHAELLHIPLADGGEGTSECFDGTRITLPTTDAAGRLTEATYTFDDGQHSGLAQAYIDVAAASGLPAVADNPVPKTGDTYGTGVLVADAIARGAQRITLGLGGSATVDGGTGIMVALGATPMDADGHPLQPGGAALLNFDHFDTAQLNIPAAATEWLLLADVDSPATGPKGAAAVFGPQKGATEEDVAILDQALNQLCQCTDIDPQRPGLGAAGGTPISILAISKLLHGDDSHVHILPGAQMIAQATGLREHIQDADVVITGEGSYDHQSSMGKVTGMVLDIASSSNTPAAVIAGVLKTRPPAGVIGIELIEADIRAQLVDAGRKVAQALIDTVQG